MKDKDYYKKYEPIFGSWYIKREIGSGSFGTVFEIEREELGETFKAALKVISIPESSQELYQTMQSEDMSEQEASTYYKSIVQEFNKECVLMSKLKGNTNIVNYEDHKIIAHEDGIGWDILIRMELLIPFYMYAKTNTITEKLVIRLGIDICNALELCENDKIIHRDIKPENIFVASSGSFKLGDFGVARMVESTTGASTRVGTFDYAAPEVFKGEHKYDSRVDIYSLGMVMYRLMNENRLPFLPLPPEPVVFSQREEARRRRMGGEKIPAPNNASKELSDVILKACAYDLNDRFASAAQMRMALESIGKELQVSSNDHVNEINLKKEGKEDSELYSEKNINRNEAQIENSKVDHISNNSEPKKRTDKVNYKTQYVPYTRDVNKTPQSNRDQEKSFITEHWRKDSGLKKPKIDNNRLRDNRCMLCGATIAFNETLCLNCQEKEEQKEKRENIQKIIYLIIVSLALIMAIIGLIFLSMYNWWGVGYLIIAMFLFFIIHYFF